jgi:hypothetical protein
MTLDSESYRIRTKALNEELNTKLKIARAKIRTEVHEAFNQIMAFKFPQIVEKEMYDTIIDLS